MSLSECSFLSIFSFLLAFSTHIPMHLTSPAAKVWYFCPPVCSSLSHFHLPHCPSVHLSIQILRGRALRLSVHAASLKAVQWHVQSFEYISAYSGCYMLALFCVCTHLRPRNAFPMELCNTPVLSQKVPVHHTKKWQRKKDSWDTLW